MRITTDTWNYLNAYSAEVFGQQDAHLEGLMAEAVAAGLPDIAVTADAGRMLMMLTSMTRGRLALELGTLGGYSGIWIARGLQQGGRLITIEPVPLHADFATSQFERAGVGDRVEVRRGAGLDVLPTLAAELGEGSVDVVFLDAIKTEYPDYWTHVRPLIAPGGLILADNVYGGGATGMTGWMIADEDDARRIAVDEFNRTVAADPEFETVAVALRQGLLIGRRRS